MGVLDEGDWAESSGVAAQNRLEESIRTGRLKVGEKLPSQRALATHYGVAKSTMQAIIQNLTFKGLIHTEPGRGTYVAPRHAADFIERGEMEPARLAPGEQGVELTEAEVAALDDPDRRARAEMLGWVFIRVHEMLAGASFVEVRDEYPGRTAVRWSGGPALRDMVAEVTSHVSAAGERKWSGVPGLRLIRMTPDEAEFLWNAREPRRFVLRRDPD